MADGRVEYHDGVDPAAGRSWLVGNDRVASIGLQSPSMSDDLRWRLGARYPGHDYRVFSHVVRRRDATSRRARRSGFSIIEAG